MLKHPKKTGKSTGYEITGRSLSGRLQETIIRTIEELMDHHGIDCIKITRPEGSAVNNRRRRATQRITGL